MAAKRKRPCPPTPPTIHVASLADRSEGRLHGVWLEATAGADELRESIAQMLAASPISAAEKWAIIDVEGFHDIAIGAHESLAVVAELAAGIAAHGPAFAAWYCRFEPEPPELAAEFLSAFRGEHWGAESYVWDLFGPAIDEVYARTRSSSLSPYVDVDVTRLTQDLVARGEIVVIKAADYGQVWVFAGDGVAVRPDDDWAHWYRE